MGKLLMRNVLFMLSLQLLSSTATIASLTLLFTSFSLGRISRSKPSAWPLTLLPPFMWFPRARTSATTLLTSQLSSKTFQPQTGKIRLKSIWWGFCTEPRKAARTSQTEETVLSLRWTDVTPSVKAERKMMQWALSAKSGIWDSSYRNLEHNHVDGKGWA